MFHKRLSIYGKRLKSSLVALLFVGTQIVFPIAMSGVASAAVPPPLPSSDCTVDTAGANDVPNQKDLNQMCADTSALPVTEHITWNWDELGSSGANTLDACALFDTNGDGNAEYSACVTTLGNPATLSALTVYSCNNTSSERCFGSAVVPAPLSAASCQVYQQGSDPFNASAPNG
ncbi:MAG TPA: hypothetical protein VLF87_02580, partial [Patescibacteria group bacterium]|nr:hypothetical protein [Patescibacteria group bacterium]